MSFLYIYSVTDVEIPAIEVIRCFVASNTAKKVGYALGTNTEFLVYFKNILNEYLDKDFAYLENFVSDKKRLKRFLEHRWFKKEVLLKYVGGWPKIGDLPKDWCEGSVVDVASRVINNQNCEYKSVEEVKKLVPVINSVLICFPPILVQGGEIRAGKELLFTPYDEDDGSHRSIAAVVAGKEFIDAFVGIP